MKHLPFDSELLCEVIRESRRASGLTQAQLALKVAVGLPYISQIESGKALPSDELLERLAKTLQLNPLFLSLLAGRLTPALLREFSTNPWLATSFLETWERWKLKKKVKS